MAHGNQCVRLRMSTLLLVNLLFLDICVLLTISDVNEFNASSTVGL